jgi:hypothetical protein
MIAVALLVLALVLILGSTYVACCRRENELKNGNFVFDPIPWYENSNVNNNQKAEDVTVFGSNADEPITAYKGYPPGMVINGIPVDLD